MKKSIEYSKEDFRKEAIEFPMMIIISIVYPCNFGCPNCPYTDGNSELRKFYSERGGDEFPFELWKKIAIEAGPYGSFLRLTGGGEPMLHTRAVEMIEFAKEQGARIWQNTNGSLFGPGEKQRKDLERIILAGVDIIEFSMDSGDAQTYNIVRPPIKGTIQNIQRRWENQVSNIRAALELRKKHKKPTRIVVSIIQQEILEGKLQDAVDFWMKEVGVDEVITRKFLTWDDNTKLKHNKALDRHLYANLASEKKEPCVWLFERLNVDTLGRISLCGQDIGFQTADLFPNANEVSIKDIWTGEQFNWYRKMHLEGRGAECFPCRGCSAWFAGIRDWEHGWIKVLKNSGERLKEVMKKDIGAEVSFHTPEY